MGGAGAPDLGGVARAKTWARENNKDDAFKALTTLVTSVAVTEARFSAS